MVYNTQNNWLSGLWPSSGYLNNQKATFRKLDLFSYSGEGKEASTLFSSLERANRKT
jgi:hypothetical protein